MAVIVAATGCSGGRAETVTPSGGGRGGGPNAAVPISVGQAVRKEMPLELRVIGTAEPSTTVSVHAQLTGQLLSVNFKEGDDVKEGQEIFTLDRRPLEAALKQAQANLQRDTAQATNAGAQAQRLVDLAARGIATREQVETAQANAQALDATIGADQAAVDNATIQLQYATITAPISGRTGALMVHEGNLVRANDTTPLVIINSVTPINVTFAVPEAQLPALKRYMASGNVPVTVTPPSETDSTQGRLTFLDNSVDMTTGTIKAKAVFANTDRRLWPGQFLNVVLRLATDPNAIVVPTPAVQTGQNGSYVFVIKSDQTAELRNVKVGRVAGSETIVTDGLTGGETVVTDGHLRLTPGAHVSVKKDSQETGS